jgi:uncharacterized membrane protein YbhN (UPF0104 family)/tRNA A-37 threonylcarbamoyl transferase component Bud32
MVFVHRDDEAQQGAVSRIFASSGDETRVVRTADWVMLATGFVALAFSAWASDARTDLERWITSIFVSAPNWVTSISRVMFAFCGVVIVGLLVLLASRRTRRALLRDALIAAVLTVVIGMVVGRWVSGEWPIVLPEFNGDDGTPSFPLIRLAILVATLFAVRPSLTLPMRRFDRWLIGLTILSALVLGYGTLTNVIGAVSLGIAAGAATRVMFGTSVGIPTLDRVRASLRDLHVEATQVGYATDGARGRLRATAVDAHGPIDITIYGRDAADSAFFSRLWRAMWYRDGRSLLSVSREQQAGHEALVLLLARRAGVTVPEVVTVGPASTGDVLLVTRNEGRLTLAEVDSTRITDEVLGRLWSALSRLHDADLSHGRLNASSITASEIDPEALPGFRDMSASVLSPEPLAVDVDVVELLVLTALLTDVDRAVDAAVAHVDHSELVRALPAIQPAALGRELTKSLRAKPLKLDDLREQLATALDVEEPQPVQLRRVRLRDVFMWALLLLAINVFVSWVMSIDLETFLEDLSNASVGWLLVGLFVVQFTNLADTVSLMGLVTHPLPFAPTMQFQYATNYIGLAVPSDAGRIALTIRYLQKAGVPTRIAMGQGPFTTVFGYIIDAVLLLVSAQVVGATLELPDDVDFSGFITLVTILVVGAVCAIIAVLVVPKLRQAIVPPVKDTVKELASAFTDPGRVVRLLGGITAKKLLFSLTLAATLAAYGEPLPFAAVVFVNIAVSWFAGIIPVPGGIGVAEAGITVGLVAFGVPETTALAIAITNRLLSTYLPTIPGYFMFKRLERNGYL